MPTFIKARVAQDRLHGVTDVNASIKNGLGVAVELALPSLQTDACMLLARNFRACKFDSCAPDHLREIRFVDVRHHAEVTLARATIAGRPFTLIDYGDTIPRTKDEPINDEFGEITTHRNQCLAIHLAAGDVHMQSGNILSTCRSQVTQSSIIVRWSQYMQAKDCQSAAGPSMGNDPLALLEFRAHAPDALHPHHDRGRRSLIFFAPAVPMKRNVCAIRVSPT